VPPSFKKGTVMRLVLASRKNAHVYAHWVTACGKKTMPNRHEMQPDVMPIDLLPELPYLYIAEVMRDELGTWFKFRLMGTGLAERLKQDGTGKMLLDLQIGGWEEEWRKNLVSTMQAKLPVVDESTIKTEAGLVLDIEHLALPLSEDGVNVDRIFGCIDFFGANEAELSKIIPELDWTKISSVELAKRIIISNLRIQI
jgi:hypothetical protein